MTFDEVLQKPNKEYYLTRALEDLLFTIEEATSVDEILDSEEYETAKKLVR